MGQFCRKAPTLLQKGRYYEKMDSAGAGNRLDPDIVRLPRQRGNNNGKAGTASHDNCTEGPCHHGCTYYRSTHYPGSYYRCTYYCAAHHGRTYHPGIHYPGTYYCAAHHGRTYHPGTHYPGTYHRAAYYCSTYHGTYPQLGRCYLRQGQDLHRLRRN